MEHIDWTAITNAITAVILVVITWLIYQTNLRLTHFTGALESHSTTMLRIEAARGIDGEPVEVVWWDKSLGAPPTMRGHEQVAKLERIYLLLPESERRFPPSTMDRVFTAFFGKNQLYRPTPFSSAELLGDCSIRVVLLKGQSYLADRTRIGHCHLFVVRRRRISVRRSFVNAC